MEGSVDYKGKTVLLSADRIPDCSTTKATSLIQQGAKLIFWSDSDVKPKDRLELSTLLGVKVEVKANYGGEVQYLAANYGGEVQYVAPNYEEEVQYLVANYGGEVQYVAPNYEEEVQYLVAEMPEGGVLLLENVKDFNKLASLADFCGEKLGLVKKSMMKKVKAFLKYLLPCCWIAGGAVVKGVLDEAMADAFSA